MNSIAEYCLAGVASSSEAYARMTNHTTPHYFQPESYIVSKVADKLVEHGLVVTLEWHIHDIAEELTGLRPTSRQLKNGRADLTLWTKGGDKPSCLIEAKRLKTPNSCNLDAQRLRNLREYLIMSGVKNPPVLLLLVYCWGKVRDGVTSRIEKASVQAKAEIIRLGAPKLEGDLDNESWFWSAAVLRVSNA